MIRILIRRGWSAPFAIVGGLASLAYLLAHRWWVAEWAGGVQAATNAIVILAPCCVFAAAADVRRAMPREGGNWLNPTAKRPSRWTVFILGIWLPYAAVVGFLLVNVFALNWGVSQFHLPGVIVLQPFAWTLLFASLGALVGRYLPLIAAAPVSLVCGFVLPVLLAGTPDTWSALLTPIDDGAISAPILLRPEVVILQVALCVAAAWLFAVFAFAPKSGSGRIRASAVVVLVIVAGALLHAGPERRYVAVAASGPRECEARQGAHVCVWSDHGQLLTPAVDIWARLRAVVPSDATSLPGGFVERGLSAPPDWANFTTGTALASRPELAMELSQQTMSWIACGSQGTLMPSPAVSLRGFWLLAKMDLLAPGDVPPALQRVLGLPVERQAQWWLSGPLTEVSSCIDH